MTHAHAAKGSSIEDLMKITGLVIPFEELESEDRPSITAIILGAMEHLAEPGTPGD